MSRSQIGHTFARFDPQWQPLSLRVALVLFLVSLLAGGLRGGFGRRL
jgi:hypothetical protein